MSEKIRWAIAAAIAFVFGVLAFLHGRETADVIKARLAANKAKGLSLEKQLEAAKAEAEAEQDEERKRPLIAKADTLSAKREDLQRQRTSLVDGLSTKGVSDVELARARNNHASRNSSAA